MENRLGGGKGSGLSQANGKKDFGDLLVELIYGTEAENAARKLAKQKKRMAEALRKKQSIE
jgi:hypothetical protein